MSNDSNRQSGRRRGFDFDEKPKPAPTAAPNRERTLDDVPPSALQRVTRAITNSGMQIKIDANANPGISVVRDNAPKKKVPIPRVLVATHIALRQRIAQSFFRKILNLPELVIESVGSVDEMMLIQNAQEFNYALFDAEMPAWETVQMILQKKAPNCKIKVSKNFAVDFKNFNG
ncbi:MAG: hypothetical protein ABIH86_05605 [Planctomycetota bacterium]